jgi:PAS domain S-box-containing protein
LTSDGESSAGRAATETERLRALRAYGVLDTEREPAFDEIAELAGRICEAPIAVINLIDADRQWFKAEVGLGVCETPLETSFCRHALLEQDRMVVPDATQDARFACNSLVTGEAGLRFYAGVLLKSPEGHPIGTLCILDVVPRPGGLTDLQMQTLEVLARQVMSQLELRRALRERTQTQERLDLALDASEMVGAWDLDLVEDRVTADARFARMFGVDPERAAAGVPLGEFVGSIHPDDRERVSHEISAAVDAMAAFESEYRLLVDGRETWVLARGQAYGDGTGAATRFPGVAVDITRRKTVEAELAATVEALADSEAKFRAIADSMPQMVWSTLPDGFHDYYNARWYEFTGVPDGSTDGEGWNGMFHPDDQDRAWARWNHSLETGEPYDIEYRLRRRDGMYRWTLGRAMPIRNEAGEITRWFGTCTDIDDLKRIEQAKELLSQELSHRIKNIFAVVSALVALSARQHPEARAFALGLRTRIGALARAHEFVRPHTETSRPTVGSMTLHAFLRALFAAYLDDAGAPRIVVSGEDTVFDDQAATSVALLFHELATNAAKYGALSQDEGRVSLETAFDEDRFHFHWVEIGGPRVDGPPERRGFGSSLAELSVQGQLGGRLSHDWNPQGLKVFVDLPATALSRRRHALKAGEAAGSAA